MDAAPQTAERASASPAERREAAADLGRSFKAASSAVRRLRGRDAHRPGELSDLQYGVLFELLAGDGLPAGELAAAAGVSPAAMTELLDRLADSGLVERARSESDRRVVLCHLTAAGRQRCEERRARVEPLWQAALSVYSVSELATAAAVLETMRELFDRLGEERAAAGGPGLAVPPVP